METPEFITFIYVRDLKASLEFYSSVLGFQEVLDQQGACKILRVNQGAYIGICRSQDLAALKLDEQKNIILTLVTDDVDKIFQQLRDSDVSLKTEPRLNEKFQIYHFFVRDPDGYLVEIQKFIDPRWGNF